MSPIRIVVCFRGYFHSPRIQQGGCILRLINRCVYLQKSRSCKTVILPPDGGSSQLPCQLPTPLRLLRKFPSFGKTQDVGSHGFCRKASQYIQTIPDLLHYLRRAETRYHVPILNRLVLSPIFHSQLPLPSSIAPYTRSGITSPIAVLAFSCT